MLYDLVAKSLKSYTALGEHVPNNFDPGWGSLRPSQPEQIRTLELKILQRFFKGPL